MSTTTGADRGRQVSGPVLLVRTTTTVPVPPLPDRTDRARRAAPEVAAHLRRLRTAG